jgi:hypothetical protein
MSQMMAAAAQGEHRCRMGAAMNLKPDLRLSVATAQAIVDQAVS